MANLLTEVHSIPRLKTNGSIAERPKPTSGSATVKPSAPISNAEDVLQVLRSRPDRKDLKNALQFLVSKHESKQNQHAKFDIRKPSPLGAKIINELVATIIPDYWSVLSEEARRNEHPVERDLLLECLRTLAGLGAIVARLRLLASTSAAPEAGQRSYSPTLSDLISISQLLLEGQHVVCGLWTQMTEIASSTSEHKLLWKELITLLASGRYVSAVAQGEAAIGTSIDSENCSWIAKGGEYASWLGRNIAFLVKVTNDIGEEQVLVDAGQLCSRSFNLGYQSTIVEAIVREIVLTDSKHGACLNRLVLRLASLEQSKFLEHAMRLYSRSFKLDSLSSSSETTTKVSTVAGLMAILTKNSRPLLTKMQEWLSDPSKCCTEPLLSRRAALAVIAQDEDSIQAVVEKNMNMFGESLFVQHAPIIQQQTCAENLLISCGVVHRTQPMFLFTLARSSTHMSGISNRLNSSSIKARVLGMCVAMAISDLVDKSGQKMIFDGEDVKTDEAASLMALTQVRDKPSSSDDAITSFKNKEQHPSAGQPRKPVPVHGMISKPPRKTHKHVNAVQSQSPGPRVIEILDDDDDDGDLVPYSKPDSDPEDEDEDPTLVNHNKAKAPVYIRDLIAGLQDTENYDRQRLALENAASLIRRKSSFGKEVSDHAFELGTILAGLGDTFDLENFAELRLQALIALLISDPKSQAPKFARQVFDGDYSLSQRATLLSAIGLSARELAGYKDEDALNPSVTSSNSFPSKRLPERYHTLYATASLKDSQRLPLTPLQAIASNLEQSMIQPLAASAADAASGPSALKVRTFSSRMAVSQRTKSIPNTLAKMLAEFFFFPLIGHWSSHAQAYGSSRNIHFQPFLLSTYLKTLALLLHASGPGTVNLPQLTTEFWDLLLSVRSTATEDVSVLEAVLFSLLTVLEVNEDQRRLVEEHSRQLVETQEWAELVFGRASNADKEGERVRMLAAGVLIRTREVVEKYQRLLVGDLMDY